VNKENVTGAAYVRVSTDEQTELSPDAQVRVILEAAKKEGIRIPSEYVFIEDRGRSGRRANGRQALLPLLLSATPLVGGQAVMEGVMMRNGGVYAIALRQPDGDIAVERRPWFSLTNNPVLRQPFLRGFPILIETLVNGIRALNRSAAVAAKTDDEELSGWSLFLTLCVSLALAVGLFVVAPHLLSLLMKELGMGGDVEGLSFHLWDGLFKFDDSTSRTGFLSKSIGWP